MQQPLTRRENVRAGLQLALLHKEACVDKRQRQKTHPQRGQRQEQQEAGLWWVQGQAAGPGVGVYTAAATEPGQRLMLRCRCPCGGYRIALNPSSARWPACTLAPPPSLHSTRLI